MVDSPLEVLGVLVVASPFLLLAILGSSSLIGRPLGEAVIARLTQLAVVLGILPVIVIFISMLAYSSRHISIDLGDWVAIPEENFHFHFKLVFDRLSVPFVFLSFLLCGVVSAFTRRYLHRELGYNRFFVLFALFFAGMVLSSVAGTIETLFLGWELVGLSSALLVGYFHERQSPVQNGQRVWSVYRLADAAFLLAALLMHHLTGQGDLTTFMGDQPWPDGVSTLTAQTALPVGLLLLLAAAGKSGLVPFSGWLPRAMEGPTPSSAIFYGALSVHLGAYLLLRTSPILECSLVLQTLVIALGLVSAICGAMMSLVQSDIKSCLAYASLTQVGIIVVEIGLGFYYLALIHIFGHACLRTLQLLRAPMLLTDYHALENAMGQQLSHQRSFFTNFFPKRFRDAAFRFAYERGFMDLALDRYCVAPFVAIFAWSDRQERRWTDWISGAASRESDTIERHPEETEPVDFRDSQMLPHAMLTDDSSTLSATSEDPASEASPSRNGRDA